MSISEAAQPSTRASISVKKAIDSAKFVEGVIFTGKLFGIEDVKEEAGDEVCNKSMIKLKAIVKATKEHKQPVFIKISLEGIEIMDQVTKETLHKHSVPSISYIARDPTDDKAFGYIFKNEKNELQYIGISHKPSIEVVLTLKDLFEVVYELKMIRKEQEESNSEDIAKVVPTVVKQDDTKASNVDLLAEVIVPTQPEQDLLNVAVPDTDIQVADLTKKLEQSVNISQKVNDLFGDLAVSAQSVPIDPPLMPQASQPKSSADILLLFDAPTQPVKPNIQEQQQQQQQQQEVKSLPAKKDEKASDLFDISLENLDKYYAIQKAAPLIQPSSFFPRPPSMASQLSQQFPQQSLLQPNPSQQFQQIPFQANQQFQQAAYSPYNANQFTTVPQNSPINQSNLPPLQPLSNQINAARSFVQPSNPSFGMNPVMQVPTQTSTIGFPQVQPLLQPQNPSQPQQFPINQFQW